MGFGVGSLGLRYLIWFCYWVSDDELADLRSDTVKSRRAAFSPGTGKNLRVQFKSFVLFCNYFKLCAVPVSQDTLDIYVQFLSRSFKSIVSIKNYVNGVKVLHLTVGAPFPETDYAFQLLLRGLGRLNPHEEAQALPVTPLLLLRIHEIMDLSNTFNKALWAVFVMSFFLFARKANMVPPSVTQFDVRKHLARGDISDSVDGLVVVFKWSKTIQLGERHLTIPLLALPDSHLCPVRAYRDMLRAVPAGGSSPAFLYLSDKSKPVTLTHVTFVESFRRLLKRVGVNPKGYSGHSFRRGGASCAFQAGVPGELVQLHGDWRSDAYLKYLTVPMQVRLQVTQRMRSFISQGSSVG